MVYLVPPNPVDGSTLVGRAANSGIGRAANSNRAYTWCADAHTWRADTHTRSNADSRCACSDCRSAGHTGIADRGYRCSHHCLSRGHQASVRIQ